MSLLYDQYTRGDRCARVSCCEFKRVILAREDIKIRRGSSTTHETYRKVLISAITYHVYVIGEAESCCKAVDITVYDLTSMSFVLFLPWIISSTIPTKVIPHSIPNTCRSTLYQTKKIPFKNLDLHNLFSYGAFRHWIMDKWKSKVLLYYW